jgi:hypothetical protein
MTSSDGPTDDQAGTDLEATRRLLDDLRHHLVKTVDALDAGVDVAPAEARPATPTPPRPVPMPPVRMEQRARAPEPTADLDDLVDLLVPRLLDKLVPALRDALRNDG